MTAKEQVRRILKAAPHLPTQALTGLAIILFGIPMLLNEMFDSGFIRWIKTEGRVSTDKGVQERNRNGKPEYFYTIDYAYEANGQTLVLPLEKGYDERDVAHDELKEKLDQSQPVTIWFDQANPSRATFDEHRTTWQTHLGILILLILPVIYFRWLMLKYYELELEETKY